MLSILVINWRDIHNPEAGGAEVHLHEVFKRIAARGHRVTLLASGFPGGAREEEIDRIRVVRRGGKLLFNYHVPPAVIRLLKDEHFDVVVDDINKIPFFTPAYVTKPVLALAHHLFACTIFLEASLPAALYVYLSEWLIPLFYRGTRMVVVSESTREEMIRRGMPRGKLGVIYNAVDHEVYRPGEGAGAEAPVVGYIGRIKKYKRIDYVLDAFKQVLGEVPEARLEIGGSGDYLESLKARAERLGIAGNTSFLGYVTEEEKVKLLRRSHVVLNPSSKEGWGVTVIEANACGAPVIASRVPGLRDAVVDGQTGFLVPYGDVGAFARKTVEILRDRPLRERLSEGALKWARRFNWEDSALGILEEIEQAAGGGSERR
jgi:glycosyltransferase involved in cell wall biosynthesis